MIRTALPYLAGSFFVGVGLGSGVAVLVMKRRHDKEMEGLEADLEKMNATRREMRRIIDNLQARDPQEPLPPIYEDDDLDGVTFPDGEVPPTAAELIAAFEEKRHGAPAKPAFVDYSKAFSRSKPGEAPTLADDEPVDDGEDSEADEAIEIVPINRNKPYVISEYEWESERSDYEKTTISYYLTDGVLADEQDAVIDDPDYAIGDCLGRFGEKTGDNDLVYVRNDVLETDFEVVRVHKGYVETVFGFGPRKEKSRPQKMRPDDDS